MQVASPQHKKDRMALSAYFLGGDVLPSGVNDTTLVGSTLMFVFPPRIGALALNESIFHFIPIELLLKERQLGGKDLVQAAVSLLTTRVTTLGEIVRGGRVAVEVRGNYVSPEDADVIAEIRGLRPQSISWSNVCDYFKPRAFHRLASSLSSATTKHYLFPMNWPIVVFGASLLDYDDAKERGRILKRAEAHLKKEGRRHGIDKVLFVPPMTNPLNVAGQLLMSTLFEKWTAAFMAQAERPVNVNATAMYPYTDLLHTGSTLSIEYVYK
jgi:hypothetical protein